MANLWLGILAYLVFIALFCAAWSRVLPPPQNSSRAIAHFERLRRLRQVLNKAFNPRPPNSGMESLLKRLDRVK